jgi:hypothetical protein
MSSGSNNPLAAIKKRLAEEERRRQEYDLWLASPAGQYGKNFGARLEPWVLELARGLEESEKVPVVAMRVTRRVVRKDDPAEWPCGRGEFEATVHRLPAETVEEGFKSTPFLNGCRCPPGDAWGLVLGVKPETDGLLAYGILPGARQFWFTAAEIGDSVESARYFDGTPGHDQIAPGEVVVQVSGVLDTSDEENPPHPCSLGSFSLEHTTNFYYPVRGAEFALSATMEAFLRGGELVPQFTRRPPPPPAAPAPPPIDKRRPGR